MCKGYVAYKKINKHQIQSLLGYLIYIHKAITSACLFVNRVNALLKVVPDTGNVLITQDFKRDLHWFVAFADLYNGITNLRVEL
jgi:hypothetical protein